MSAASLDGKALLIMAPTGPILPIPLTHWLIPMFPQLPHTGRMYKMLYALPSILMWLPLRGCKRFPPLNEDLRNFFFMFLPLRWRVIPLLPVPEPGLSYQGLQV